MRAPYLSTLRRWSPRQNNQNYHVTLDGGLGINMVRGLAGTGPIAHALEAASIGLPVIMTNCTGHLDFADDIGGPFVDWDDEEETIAGEDFPVHPVMKAGIAGCILSMIWDYPSVAEKYLDNRAKIVDKWSWTAVVKRWLDERYGS